MSKQDVFNIWAPREAIWSPWVKPVLFSEMDTPGINLLPRVDPPIDVAWAVDAQRTTAIVIDLPGTRAISLALSLATIGYRPVPLFNACPEPMGDMPVVNVRPIMLALSAVATALNGLNLPIDAPPVFILDANRNIPIATPEPGMFDNRSISLPTDFPSGNLLLSRSIQRIILFQPHNGNPQPDLSHTLRRWQEAGLTIHATSLDNPTAPTPITVERPNAFRVLWYNLLAKAGLISNPLGGFGGHLPMPSSG